MRFPRLAGAIRDVVKSTWLKETLLALPRIAVLIPNLMSDRRVPARTKAALAGLAVYLVSPWDIIPDFIPGLGQLDGVVVMLLFVDGILNKVQLPLKLKPHTSLRIEQNGFIAYCRHERNPPLIGRPWIELSAN